MISTKARWVVSALVLPAPMCMAVMPVAVAYERAASAGLRVGGSEPSSVMILLFGLFGFVPVVLLLGALHRPEGHARAWAGASIGFATLATLLMVYMGVRMVNGFAELGAGDLGVWAFGSAVAGYGPHVGSSILAAALAVRRREAIVVATLVAAMLPLAGLAAATQLTRLTWGVTFAWSARELVLWGHAFFLPELVIAALWVAMRAKDPVESAATAEL